MHSAESSEKPIISYIREQKLQDRSGVPNYK